MLIRSEDVVSGGGGAVSSWQPVCGCGTTVEPTPTGANAPQAYASGGPANKPYIDCHVDTSQVTRDLDFGDADRTSFEFEASTDGFIVTAVTRLRTTPKTSLARFLFGVRENLVACGCVWMCVCGWHPVCLCVCLLTLPNQNPMLCGMVCGDPLCVSLASMHQTDTASFCTIAATLRCVCVLLLLLLPSPGCLVADQMTHTVSLHVYHSRCS